LNEKEKNLLNVIQMILQEILFLTNSVEERISTNEEIINLINKIILLLSASTSSSSSVPLKTTTEENNVLKKLQNIQETYLFAISPVLRAFGIKEVKEIIQKQPLVSSLYF
jgi:hypothetical protein